MDDIQHVISFEVTQVSQKFGAGAPARSKGVEILPAATNVTIT